MAAVDTSPPDLPTVSGRSVDPRTIPVWRWSTLAAFLPAAIGLPVVATALSLGRLPAAPALWLAWLLVLALAAIVTWLYPPARYRHLGYRVDETGITIRHGVFWRTQSSLPQVRIQHTDVSQGPLQRRHGVATLKLYTAGSRFTRTELPGLEYSEAVALRDRLQRQRHGDEV